MLVLEKGMKLPVNVVSRQCYTRKSPKRHEEEKTQTYKYARELSKMKNTGKVQDESKCRYGQIKCG